MNKTEIAQEIGVHKSTVSRELSRNSLSQGRYSARLAHNRAQEQKGRYTFNRKFTGELEYRVKKYIEQEQWSPEQIFGYCKKAGLKMVSVERIYQYIRSDKSKGGTLYKNLRHKLKHRKRFLSGKSSSRIKDRIS